jgi:hypothetical protein
MGCIYSRDIVKEGSYPSSIGYGNIGTKNNKGQKKEKRR